MKKRLITLFLTITLLLSFVGSNSLACDEEQTNTYVSQVLFGNYALSKSSDEKVKMLMAALYLCSEQSDNSGQDKINYLKSKKVSNVPTLSEINIKKEELIDCSHIKWEDEYSTAKKIQTNRKKILRNTVNKVFDFGFFNNLFGSNKGKCDSFSALLYYTHILSDYLADDPNETAPNVNGKLIPPYSGTPYYIINGDMPTFMINDRSVAVSNITYSPLDNLQRAGVASGIIGPDILKTGGRDYIGNIFPPGWNNDTYKDIGVSPQTIYNRSHLIAHELGGDDADYNLITGTDYMNKRGMKHEEDEIAKHIRNTGNHVIYRVTPIYQGNNKVCSGIQMEAYSIEDKGEGIHYNRFYYNVQPGFRINYMTGETYFYDTIVDSKKKLPFALSVYEKKSNETDLFDEMTKHIEILFKDTKKKDTYNELMNQISIIATDARGVEGQPNSASKYIRLKELQYKYLETLKIHVPILLENEDFFKSAFK